MSRPAPSRTPLSPVDVAWLRMEDPTNMMMITGIFTFDQPLNFDKLKSLLATRLLHFRRFRQKIIQPKPSFLPPYWIDDETFNIDAHLHRIALPEPRNQEALQLLVNDFMSTPLDFSKPLWQFHLIENYGEGCALLCRLHHCIADGIALMQVLLGLTTDSENGNWTGFGDEEASQKTKRHRPRMEDNPVAVRIKKSRDFAKNMARRGIKTLKSPSKTLAAFQFGAESSLALANLLLLSPDPDTAFKGKLGVRKRCAWSQPISLQDVKAVGKITGGTINDVLLAATAGALGRYLRFRGEATGGLDIRAAVPVNLRPAGQELKLGNVFGLVFLSLPLGIDDPLERLAELKQRMDLIKGTPEAVVAFGILNLTGVVTIQIEDAIVNMFGKKATAVMTNVPGPRETRYFAGQPIRSIMFWVPQSGKLGLGVSIISYDGEVLIGIATDEGLIPDPENIVDAVHTEFDDLFELVRQVERNNIHEQQLESNDQRCIAVTKKGVRCKNHPLPDSDYCRVHAER